MKRETSPPVRDEVKAQEASMIRLCLTLLALPTGPSPFRTLLPHQ